MIIGLIEVIFLVIKERIVEEKETEYFIDTIPKSKQKELMKRREQRNKM